MTFTVDELIQIAIPLGVAVLGFMVGLIVRRTVIRRVRRAAAETRSLVDEVILAAVRGPVVLWFFIAGLYGAIQVTELDDSVRLLIQSVLVVLVVLSITWAVARVAGAVVQGLAEQAHIPSATLMTNLARVLVLSIGVLVVLQTLGISIAPIITALGIGGLAVALALQPTLANLFAGIQILAARQLRPGDYVKIASGEEGYVVDVTWRQTTIRQLPNNIIIVPNSQIASTITTNFHLPEPEMSVLVQVGVAYDSDLELVERVTIEVAKEVMNEVEGGVEGFEPFTRYHTFGDSSINFSVIMRAKEFVNQYLIKHEFVKRLHRRYKTEGIEIPFPIRTVYMAGDEQAD